MRIGVIASYIGGLGGAETLVYNAIGRFQDAGHDVYIYYIKSDIELEDPNYIQVYGYEGQDYSGLDCIFMNDSWNLPLVESVCSTFKGPVYIPMHFGIYQKESFTEESFNILDSYQMQARDACYSKYPNIIPLMFSYAQFIVYKKFFSNTLYVPLNVSPRFMTSRNIKPGTHNIVFATNDLIRWETKGVKDIIELALRCNKNKLRFKFKILGDNSEIAMDTIKTYFKELPGNLEFTGKVDPDSYFREANICVISSKYEAFCLVAKEASYNCRLLVSDHMGAIADTCDEGRTVTYKHGDISDMLAKLVWLSSINVSSPRSKYEYHIEDILEGKNGTAPKSERLLNLDKKALLDWSDEIVDDVDRDESRQYIKAIYKQSPYKNYLKYWYPFLREEM